MKIKIEEMDKWVRALWEPKDGEMGEAKKKQTGNDGPPTFRCFRCAKNCWFPRLEFSLVSHINIPVLFYYYFF